MKSRRPLSTSRTFYLLGLGHQRSTSARDRPGPIATNRYAGEQSGDAGASSKSTDRSTGMNASRPPSLTSLCVAGPFSMGYVDFHTFLIPLYGLSLGFDASPQPADRFSLNFLGRM
jgi:hypothetical protein